MTGLVPLIRGGGLATPKILSVTILITVIIFISLNINGERARLKFLEDSLLLELSNGLSRVLLGAFRLVDLADGHLV